MSISSAHCPACGAPITDDAADACVYCGAVLNDGSRSWVLTNVLSMSSPEAQRYLASDGGLLLKDAVAKLTADQTVAHPPPPAPGAGSATGAEAAAASPQARAPAPEASGLIAWMVSAVAVQGDGDPREQSMLAHAASNRGIDKQRLQIMASAAAAGNLQAPQPANPAQAANWLGAMANAALVDGGVDNQEYQLLMAVGRRYRLSSYDVNMIIRKERVKLLAAGQAARTELRQRQQPQGQGV